MGRGSAGFSLHVPTVLSLFALGQLPSDLTLCHNLPLGLFVAHDTQPPSALLVLAWILAGNLHVVCLDI